MDPGLNNLLKWSIEHSGKPDAQGAQVAGNSAEPDAAALAAAKTADAQDPGRGLVSLPRMTSPSAPLRRAQNSAALAQLMGGPSDAELMRACMATITSTDAADTLESKEVAFDNFEQLVENLDNANNLAALELWTPLVEVLRTAPEKELRFMAAWCIGTAVQNNAPAQDTALRVGALPALVAAALADADDGVRKKAVFALSSEVRNFQPGLDELVALLPDDVVAESFDAGDMDRIDAVRDKLRGRAVQG